MQVDSERVVSILQDVRAKIAAPGGWWDGSLDGPLGECAMTAFPDLMEEVAVGDAFMALADAMGVEPWLVHVWNDTHTLADVLSAFDKAIATVRLAAHLDATPNADAALEVMVACDLAGEVVARQIVAEHPHMDLQEITTLAAAELFYAAQDTAQACSLGVRMERS